MIETVPIEIINLANTMGWGYSPTSLHVRSYAECDILLQFCSLAFAQTASKLQQNFVIAWGERKEQRIEISPKQIHYIRRQNIMTASPITTEFYGITIASMNLDDILLRLFMEEFLPDPCKQLSLVRLSDMRQVAISHGQMINIKRRGVTKEQVVQRTRWDYMFWPDIENLMTEIRLLEPNNPTSTKIITNRFHDTTGQNWRSGDSKYRLIQDRSGIIYSLSEGQDVKSCTHPMGV